MNNPEHVFVKKSAVANCSELIGWFR